MQFTVDEQEYFDGITDMVTVSIKHCRLPSFSQSYSKLRVEDLNLQGCQFSLFLVKLKTTFTHILTQLTTNELLITYKLP